MGGKLERSQPKIDIPFPLRVLTSLPFPPSLLPLRPLLARLRERTRSLPLNSFYPPTRV